MEKYEISQETINILGLTRAEKKIFGVISNMGKQISTIARLTNIPRTSLLYMLRALHKRKLVETVKNGKYTYWKSKLIYLFPRIHNQEIIILKGKEQLFSVLEKIEELPTNTRVSGIQPSKSIVEVIKKVPLEKLSKLNKKIKDKKLIVEGIVHEQSIDNLIKEFGISKSKKIFEGFIGRLEDYAKIPDDFANVESEIYIFSGVAYILNWKEEIGLEIHEQNIVSLLLAMFFCVKQVGVRYNQGQKMSRYITPPNTPQ